MYVKSFALTIILYTIFQIVMAYLYIRGFVHALDILIYAICNIVIIVLLYHNRPKVENDKYIPDYIEHGQSSHDAIYGRKYRYDIIVDPKTKAT